MITYVDTSTVIKLIVEEPGSRGAALIWDSADALASARVLYAEARAALAAARRMKRISPQQHGRAAVGFEQLWNQLAIVEITQHLVVGAAELADTHALRGNDAIHLAAALSVSAEILTSADADLCRAAALHDLHIANPNMFPVDGGR